MKKILFFLCLFPVFINACALCALGIPKVHTTVSLGITQNKLQTIHVQWEFTDKFTKQLLEGYDVNLNNKLDSKELQAVEQVLTSYVAQKHYLSTISFYNETKHNEEAKDILPTWSDQKLVSKNNKLLFTFSLHVKDVVLEPNSVIKIVFEDKDGFFDFRVVPQKEYQIPTGLWIIPNANFNFVFYKISGKYKAVVEKKDISQIIPDMQKQNRSAFEEEKSQKISSYLLFLQEQLTSYTQNIKELMKEKNSPLKIFSLILFSFLYGLFHALGPGHGKTLVGSYFLAKGGNWIGAFWMSLRIGIIHVAGAFVLVMVSVYFIQTFISKVLKDVTSYTTYFSAALIILIALWMLYQKLLSHTTKVSNPLTKWSLNGDNNSSTLMQTPQQKIHHHERCSCHTCNTLPLKNNNSWFVALAAGIVPCPGTVVIFLLTFVFGNYYIGFLSAIAMAFGMGVVIFVSALFAQVLHVKLQSRWKFLPSLFEYGAIFFMLIFGILLLFFPITGA